MTYWYLYLATTITVFVIVEVVSFPPPRNHGWTAVNSLLWPMWMVLGIVALIQHLANKWR